MITFLHGTLVEKQPARIVLDVHGVGYEVLIPLSSYERLPAAGQTVRILTHHHVREDAQILFGFMTAPERDMFVLLLGASGIGPKLALSALGGLTVRELKTAVVEGDVKRLSSVPGIGRKMAERIVVELRHRLSDADALEALAGPDDTDGGNALIKDALMALIALGFKQDEARKRIKQVMDAHPELDSVEAVIKRTLAT